MGNDKRLNIALRYFRVVFSLILPGIMFILSNTALSQISGQILPAEIPPTVCASSNSIGMGNPIGISIRGRQVKDQLKVETTIQNLTTKPVSGKLEWDLRPRGKVQINPLVFRDLQPNDAITTQSGLMAGNKEAALVASVHLENGCHIEKEIGLMAIPLRLIPPRIDGSLAEWINVPQLHLDKDSQAVKSPSSPLWSKANASGAFQFWVTEEAFYIAAYITDDTPLINPRHGKEIWRGDGIELFLGLKGPSDQTYCQDMDFQIGLGPGHKGALPEMWNGKTQHTIEKGGIISCKTGHGYIIEARIPLSELGNWEPQRQEMIGFDIKLNDLDKNEGDKPALSLIWSGTSENLSNPSHWGIAIIW
jgi:hypothetical protein